MQTALILMTILGCDDSASQCHYVATAEKRWASVALCDADSEKQLGKYTNINYPTIIAVCQTPEPAADEGAVAKAEPLPAVPALDGVPEVPVVAESHPGLAARAMQRVRVAMPTLAGMKAMVRKPVHFASDSYSWVARKIGN